MLRKKKRLLEKEEEMAQKSLVPVTSKTESDDKLGTKTGEEMMTDSSIKGQELDLNCDPDEEEMMLAEAANASSIPSE